MVERLPTVEPDFDRVPHQVMLADRLSGRMRNNCQTDVVARIKRQACKGAQFSPSEWLVALAAEFCLDCPIFSEPCACY